MANSLSFFLVGVLVLAGEATGALIQSSLDEAEMEEEELLGLFEVLGALLEDPNWVQDHPQPCTDTPWPGVQCEIGEEEDPPIFHVTKIHIGPDILSSPSCKNSANLSQSLVKLPFLKTLSIFNCFVSAPVFLSSNLFAALSSLEHLSLESNPTLSGKIPKSLGKIGTLRVLTLSQNNLEGQIPKEIGDLGRLEQLDLSYNQLNGEVPEEFGGLRSLTILDLSWNILEGQLPCCFFGQLQVLRKIDLSFNKLHGRVPPDLGQLKRLVLLDLSHNFLSGPLPETLSGLQHLEYLILDQNPINTIIPSFVGALGKVTSLSLSGCGLRGPIPKSLSLLKNLTALSLDNNSLIGTVPQNLGALPNLDMLNLSHNRLSGELQFAEEFIERLGKRLDVRGNSGLCTRKNQVHKQNNSSVFLETPVCLEKTGPISDKNWPQEDPDDTKKMKPSWGHGNASSNAQMETQKFGLPSFLVFSLQFSLQFLICKYSSVWS